MAKSRRGKPDSSRRQAKSLSTTSPIAHAVSSLPIPASSSKAARSSSLSSDNADTTASSSRTVAVAATVAVTKKRKRSDGKDRANVSPSSSIAISTATLHGKKYSTTSNLPQQQQKQQNERRVDQREDPQSATTSLSGVTTTSTTETVKKGKQRPHKRKRRRKQQQQEEQDQSMVSSNELFVAANHGGTDNDDNTETPVLSRDNNAVVALINNQQEQQQQQPEFPFAVDPDDHCESPLEAYRDIAPLLSFLQQAATTAAANGGSSSSSSGTRSSRWCIYDPYYCDGAVVRNLNELGFTNVYNRKEDCYAVWEQQNTAATLPSNSSSSNSHLPPFDVLVTNPPYSDNHIERLIQFISSNAFGARPWFLLLPNWVHKKDYFVQATTKSTTTAHGKAAPQPFFMVPPSHRRYVYVPPPHFRLARKSAVHVKSSPFVSMWYCWGGTAHMNSRLMQYFYESKQQSQSQSKSSSASGSWTECDLARSKSALRDLRRKQR